MNHFSFQSEGKIYFHSEDVSFELNQEEKISSWILSIIKNHTKELGDISYIFCSDNYLLKINKKYLNHDYYTDVITFNYCEENTVSGDIFISIDRIKENSENLGENFDQELNRVIAHGVLHLIGFNDKNEAEQKIMRNKEDECLNLLKI